MYIYVYVGGRNGGGGGVGQPSPSPFIMGFLSSTLAASSSPPKPSVVFFSLVSLAKGISLFPDEKKMRKGKERKGKGGFFSLSQSALYSFFTLCKTIRLTAFPLVLDLFLDRMSPLLSFNWAPPHVSIGPPNKLDQAKRQTRSNAMLYQRTDQFLSLTLKSLL